MVSGRSPKSKVFTTTIFVFVPTASIRSGPINELSVLTLQPFYGGSHRQFIDGWIANSRHNWKVISLPDRNWKWRMRHAAIYCAEQTQKLINDGLGFDAVLATDMLNLTEYFGLVNNNVRSIPSVLYFHENQFAYPQQDPQKRDFHFSFTNLISSISADEIWFNSDFNRSSMINELNSRLKRLPDFAPIEAAARIEKKMRIEEPGIEVPENDLSKKGGQTSGSPGPIRIVWAGRWEHDKNPGDLLIALRKLRKLEVEFEISVIGQRYARCPEAFDTISTEFSDCIRAWGYQDSRDDYWKVLFESDIFLSTANHEFFGLSAVESIVAGCYPLLPDRLAYPEVISKLHSDPKTHLYESIDDLVNRIRALASGSTLSNFKSEQSLSNAAIQRFGWDSRSAAMDQRLLEVVSQTA